jgi:hypothetical protein
MDKAHGGFSGKNSDHFSEKSVDLLDGFVVLLLSACMGALR